MLRRAVENEVEQSLTSAAIPGSAGALRILQRRQTALAAIADHQAFMQAHRDFHRTMYEQAGAAALWPLIRRQGRHIDRLRRLNLPSPGKMSEILRDHLSRSLGFIETLRRRHPDPFRS